MEDFDKIFHLYNEHICLFGYVCGDVEEKYCNKVKHCNECEDLKNDNSYILK
jgi:hypothetical protein